MTGSTRGVRQRRGFAPRLVGHFGAAFRLVAQGRFFASAGHIHGTEMLNTNDSFERYSRDGLEGLTLRCATCKRWYCSPTTSASSLYLVGSPQQSEARVGLNLLPLCEKASSADVSEGARAGKRPAWNAGDFDSRRDFCRGTPPGVQYASASLAGDTARPMRCCSCPTCRPSTAIQGEMSPAPAGRLQVRLA